ncbi:MAG: ZIP family metal transporter [bacterium]
MANIYLLTISSIILVSSISLIGVLTIFASQKRLYQLSLFLVSLSAGTLLGDSFIHLIPEAVEKNNSFYLWLWLLSGLLSFFALEKFIHWRHCHINTTDAHPHPVGTMNLVGDGLHNFTDGMIIAGSYLISFPLGVATTIAVITHEIPQEIGDFGILVYAGYSRAKAIAFNFLSSLLAIIGGIITLIIGVKFENFSDFIIPFTAGGFIYIATSDLIPELKKDTAIGKSLIQLTFILLGIGLMILLKKIG